MLLLDLAMYSSVLGIHFSNYREDDYKNYMAVPVSLWLVFALRIFKRSEDIRKEEESFP